VLKWSITDLLTNEFHEAEGPPLKASEIIYHVPFEISSTDIK